MTNEQKKPLDANEKQNKDAAVKPDPETVHTPDPPKKMEGPVSSFMKDLSETFDSKESREEADKKKEEHM